MKPYFAFQWHITDDCDQRCKHCYIFSENACKALDSMSWPQMQEVVANCCDFCEVYDRQPYFYITGGDPILHPDFWRLLELLGQNGIPFTIMGNPFHLTDEACARMKAYGCEKYQLSIDGMRETHDWFRKPGSSDCTLEKIGCLNRAGIRSVVMTTVSGANIAEVPDIIDAVVEAGANVYAFARYCPTSEEKDTGITPMQYRALLETCDKKFRAYEAAGCQTYFNKKDHLWTLYEYETGRFQIPPKAQEDMIYGGCNCGNCHLTILPSGDVYACRRVQNSRVANVFENCLADVWVSEMEAYRDYGRFKKCAKCELLAWCRGCPAVAGGAHRRDFWRAAVSFQRLSGRYPKDRQGVLHPRYGDRVFSSGRAPDPAGELFDRLRTPRCKGLSDHRGLHRLRRMRAGVSAVGHPAGNALCHRAGALPALRKLHGKLPRSGCHTH